MGKLVDLVGKTFGYLTVLERAKNRKTIPAWKCICKCGNITEVIGAHLKNGHTKSCGCYSKEISEKINTKIIENGSVFGNLTVLNILQEKQNGKRRTRLYECRCICGNKIVVDRAHLIEGNTTSCGCIKSKGELEITNLLIKNNINFKKEYSFNDLFYKNKLRFDFAIFKNNNLIKLIEFQGIQHYKKIGFAKDNYEERIKRDELKREYCKTNDIELIEVKYDKLGKITLEDLKLENY